MPDGTPICWGDDSLGQASPPKGEQFVSISSGEEHTCALRADGSAVCWGDDRSRQTHPPAGGRFTAIGSGKLHTCALQADGRPTCWGYIENDPRFPLSGPRYDSIGRGQYHACAVREDGQVVCWGSDDNGEVSLAPQDETFIAVNGGRWHQCGLRSDGIPICWGGGPSPEATPRARFASLSSGAQHVCALTPDGQAVCWGNPAFGKSSPPAEERFVAITSGYEHSCGLRADGIVVCWGLIDTPPSTLLSLAIPDAPTLEDLPTPPTTDEAAMRGDCAAYNATVEWLEATYPRYSICYTAEYGEDVEFVKHWIDHAQGWMADKYAVTDWLSGGGQPLELYVVLLPASNEDADTGTTGFKCCYNESGELDSAGKIGQIVYLTPSHSAWNARIQHGGYCAGQPRTSMPRTSSMR